MATIRRLGAVVAFALLLATVPAGAAFAAVTVGTAGDDWLQGAGNADALYGLDGDDQLFGKGASDELYGGRGEDTLHGGRGADYLTGGTKLDTFFAGNGNDFVDSADGGPDDVLCGRGTGDRAALDPEDIATGCEILVNGEDAQAEK